MNIAILSRGPQLYSTQSLFRAGRRRGHYMYLYDHTLCQLLLENGQYQIIADGQQLRPIEAVIPRIGASVTGVGAAVIAQFEMMDVFAVTGSSALLRARDKMRCLQWLQYHGLPVPTTALVGGQDDLPQLVERLGGYPVVVKLLQSTHGTGVMLCHSLSSLSATVEAFQQLRERITLQEYIPEANGSDIRAFVVDGTVVAAMKRQAPAGEFRSNLHRGATAEPITLSADEEALVLRTTEVMELAVAGVDLLRSKRGPLIIEVNASPGLEGIETVTQVDIAGKIINYIERSVRTRKAAAKR